MAHEAHPMQVSAISSQKAYPLWFTSLLVNASVWVGQATIQSPHPLQRLVSMISAPLILLIAFMSYKHQEQIVLDIRKGKE